MNNIRTNYTEYAASLYDTPQQAQMACVTDWATCRGAFRFPTVDAQLADELTRAHNGGDYVVLNFPHPRMRTEEARELLEAARETWLTEHPGPYTVRPLGSAAWAEDLDTLEEADRALTEAEDRGLSRVFIVDANGETLPAGY